MSVSSREREPPPSSDDDQKFAELLKPIKDLTQNWEVSPHYYTPVILCFLPFLCQVPLSQLLSAYLEDLQQVTISLDGGQTSVNFAQAALLLQGTAAVYSRKVEYLDHQVNKMLELLGSQRDQDLEGQGEEAPRGSKGQRRRNEVPSDFEDLRMDLAKNLQLMSEEDRKRKDALKFISITPRQLLEKEGSEQKAVKVNMFTGVQHSRWDLLASKEDFKINSQYVLQTGFLGEDLNADNVYLISNRVPEDEDSVGDHASVEVETVTEFSDHQATDQALSDLEPAQNSSNSTRSDRARLSLSSLSGERALLVSPSSTSQSLLDPDQELRPPRPLQIKESRRLPPSLRAKKRPSSPIIPISEYLSQQHQPSARQMRLMPSYIPLSCYDLLKSQPRLEKSEVTRKYEEVEEEEEGADSFSTGPVEEDEEGYQDDFEDFHLPDPHLGGDLGAVAVDQVEAENDSLSYEELVARRVEEFLIKSREAMKSSELSQRVASWHEMIGPRLERLETRKAFDIHACGTQVIRKCEAAGGVEVPFRDIVRGQRKEEISR